VRLWAFLTDVLSYLKFAQLADHIRSYDQGHEKCRKACESRAERQVSEDTEWAEVLEELLIEKPIKQSMPALSGARRLR